ncbi:secreted protein containing Dystroglycan-type cadherin-like domain protein [Candidatus Magnetomorum sp. HK-1]|nr:secreted protein containing Dystroglycan-type cadherin-like domain protein [Candidatus Magnetomorum sp. HK-1]
MKNLLKKMTYIKFFFIKVTIITLVLIALYPVSLLANHPKIKEKIFDKAEVSDSTAQNNKSHRYRFKICFDTKKNINGNNYTIELILHGKYVLYGHHYAVSTQNQPEEYYSYDKKKHEFIHYKPFYKEECIIKESSRNYRIYIHDWTRSNFESIKVQTIDSSSQLPKDNIDFNTINTDFVNKVVISYTPACNNMNGECNPTIWSKKTCLDNFGFAYFSSQESIQCDDLISLFHNKKPRPVQTISNQSINEDQRNIFHVPEGTFVDDDGDRLTYEATLENGTTLPSWLIFNSTSRVFTAFPKNQDVGNHTIIVSASDEEASAYTSFVITVQNINDAPVVKKKIVPKPAIEDEQYNFKLDQNTFEDIDDGDSLTYLVTHDPPDTWLAFNESSKTFTGTPINADVGSHTITVTVIDNESASAYTSCVITVTNINNAPKKRDENIFNSPVEIFVNETKNFSFSENFFYDEDRDDTLTFSASLEDDSELPSWIVFNLQERNFQCSPEANIGDHVIKVLASDLSGESVYALFTLKVERNENETGTILMTEEPDEPPSSINQTINTISIPRLTTNINPLHFLEDEEISHYIDRQYFNDINGLFEYRTSILPDWLSFNDETLIFSGTPLNKDVGRKTISLTATEPTNGYSDKTNIIIIVENQNDKPINFRKINDVSLQIGEESDIDFDEYFQDKDRGDELNYTVTIPDTNEALPMWIYPDNGKVNIHPTRIMDIGTFPIKVIATDSNQESSEPGFFTITVKEPKQSVNIEQPAEDNCSDENLKTVEFSPNNQNDLIRNTEDYIVVSIIKTKGLIHISKINCENSYSIPRCSFCSLKPLSNSDSKADCFLWKKMRDSFEYVGKLDENDSTVPDERINLFAKPDPENSKHLKCKDKRLNSFRMNFDEINNAMSRIDQETKNIINDFFITEQFNQFYSTYSQQNYKIQIFSGDPNFILLDDNTYFQRFNKCWSLKTFDYSTGTPIYIPIPGRSLGTQYFNDVDNTNGHETQNKDINIVSVPENTAFRTTLYPNQNDKEYKYATAFGMVHLNMSFTMVNANENISSYVITSIVNNEIVFSPLFCERGLCKYYSPYSNDRNHTFVWSNQSGTYQFISSLPFRGGLRFSEMKSNFTPENKWLFDILDSFNQAIKNENEVTELCVYQSHSQRICIKDFFKQNDYSNFHRQNQYDKNMGDRYFKKYRNGNYIIFDDLYYFQKDGSYWHYKSINDRIDKYIDFPNEYVSPTTGSYPLFWGSKIDYHVYPIYHSQQKYYKTNSNEYYIGYENFKMAMDRINQSKSFTKWIIVDEYEDVDSNIMTKLFSPFRNNQLKDLIRQLSDKGKTYRFDGINGSYIRRLKITEPDYASRNFAIFANALTTIEPHSMNEKNTDWELHIFVPRNTSVSSFVISDNTYKKIINKLINLKVKGLCIWEFSNQKPLEKTPYENFINSLKQKQIPLLLKYKSIYNPNQFKEIMERFK